MKTNDNIIIYSNTKTGRFFYALAKNDIDGEMVFKKSIENPRNGFKTAEEAKKHLIENRRFIKDELHDRDGFIVFDDATYTEYATRDEVESFNLDEI